jgi:hypothetical protein
LRARGRNLSTTSGAARGQSVTLAPAPRNFSSKGLCSV